MWTPKPAPAGVAQEVFFSLHADLVSPDSLHGTVTVHFLTAEPRETPKAKFFCYRAYHVEDGTVEPLSLPSATTAERAEAGRLIRPGVPPASPKPAAVSAPKPSAALAGAAEFGGSPRAQEAAQTLSGPMNKKRSSGGQAVSTKKARPSAPPPPAAAAAAGAREGTPIPARSPAAAAAVATPKLVFAAHFCRLLHEAILLGEDAKKEAVGHPGALAAVTKAIAQASNAEDLMKRLVGSSD
jgi:hypothetical protein